MFFWFFYYLSSDINHLVMSQVSKMNTRMMSIDLISAIAVDRVSGEALVMVGSMVLVVSMYSLSIDHDAWSVEPVEPLAVSVSTGSVSVKVMLGGACHARGSHCDWS